MQMKTLRENRQRSALQNIASTDSSPADRPSTPLPRYNYQERVVKTLLSLRVSNASMPFRPQVLRRMRRVPSFDSYFSPN